MLSYRTEHRKQGDVFSRSIKDYLGQTSHGYQQIS